MENFDLNDMKKKMEDKFYECFYREGTCRYDGGFDEVHSLENENGTFMVGTYRHSETHRRYDGVSGKDIDYRTIKSRVMAIATENGKLIGDPFLFEASSREPRSARDKGDTNFSACIGRFYPEQNIALELRGGTGDEGFIDVRNFASYPDIIKCFIDDKKKYISGEKRHSGAMIFTCMFYDDKQDKRDIKLAKEVLKLCKRFASPTKDEMLAYAEELERRKRVQRFGELRKQAELRQRKADEKLALKEHRKQERNQLMLMEKLKRKFLGKGA